MYINKYKICSYISKQFKFVLIWYGILLVIITDKDNIVRSPREFDLVGWFVIELTMS